MPRSAPGGSRPPRRGRSVASSYPCAPNEVSQPRRNPLQTFCPGPPELGEIPERQSLALFGGCNPPAFLLLVFATAATNGRSGLHSRTERFETGRERLTALRLRLRRHVRHSSHAAGHRRHRAAAHLSHHLSHLVELLQELVDRAHGRARATSDARAS